MYVKQPAVYILANQSGNCLYIGVTSDLKARVWQHKNGSVGGFSKRYNIDCLVYYELFLDITDAIDREKQLKKWKRKWKENLIAKTNRCWVDLYDSL
ncbi:GIY-YIG nuclease family protein [Vibrio neptunius]|uniref:GIY-YIG nuclease family protein n=1 Tax=Vibrio neptunius TaxID=170651 RepID=A0ABS3A6B4_9VIBR|nr:GIY-YIG nuclease family protein [Vibrio neptunius]MBN3517722.1 GIY-YIG nuclease family protein [Vibrio neptunius]MBN3552018.1 GIY-YIG nuclease family protein [Vibrio neptunius]MBN3580026.1 GIY-YIG nuclease family protein [Vibrio neptunius]MCH9873692.1 GIY-YIG nuclease family protein [Vibrio neptunius]